MVTGYVLGIKEDSRIGVIQALWNYIKINGLQDKADRRKIKADDHLRPVRTYFRLRIVDTNRHQIFGGDAVAFQQLPELVNRYLMPPDPVILHYTINPTVPPPDRPSAWDIEVKMEDASLKNRMAVTIQASKDSIQDMSKIDDEVRFAFYIDVGCNETMFIHRSPSLLNLYTTHTRSGSFYKAS